MCPWSGRRDLRELDRLLSEKTKLVAFPHCSNIVAHLNPVAEICARAHAAGAVTCVDGVSYAPHGLPDVTALGADIYLFSLYKTYGPHQGLMVARSEEHTSELQSLMRISYAVFCLKKKKQT